MNYLYETQRVIVSTESLDDYILDFLILLSSSSTKFDSGSGWPSFWSAIEHEQTNEQEEIGIPNLSVDQVVDKSHGMVRVEVLCSQVM